MRRAGSRSTRCSPRARARDSPLDRDQLAALVATNDKQRFALSGDGARIRASQGHSVPVDLAYAPTEPPALLYHGTVARFLDAIRAEGLVRASRHHVHLSADPETATRVGQRRGAAVILTIAAGRMHADRHFFLRSANDVWLAESVLPCYLSFP